MKAQSRKFKLPLKIKLFITMILILPFVIELIEILRNGDNFPIYILNYLHKFIIIVKNYIVYYATSFGLVLTVLIFREGQIMNQLMYEQNLIDVKKTAEETKKKEEDLKRNEEIQKARPMFFKLDGKLVLGMAEKGMIFREILIMDNENYKKYHIGDKQSGDKVLDDVPSNFSLYGVTLKDEKILYGNSYDKEFYLTFLEKDTNSKYDYLDLNLWDSINTNKLSNGTKGYFEYKFRILLEDFINSIKTEIIDAENTVELIKRLFDSLAHDGHREKISLDKKLNVVKCVMEHINLHEEIFRFNISNDNVEYINGTLSDRLSDYMKVNKEELLINKSYKREQIINLLGKYVKLLSDNKENTDYNYILIDTIKFFYKIFEGCEIEDNYCSGLRELQDKLNSILV